MQENEIKVLEDQMLKAFKETVRVTPQFMWVPPESLPRESKKTKLIEVLSS
jgi:phenylacetate-coenzyme A ligase PaaK-like adenylate-forming protein